MVPTQVRIAVLQKLRLPRLNVHRARQTNLQPVKVRPPVPRVDGVRVPQKRVRVRLLGPLQRAFHLHAVHLRPERDRVVKRLGALVQVNHVVLQPARVRNNFLDVLHAVFVRDQGERRFLFGLGFRVVGGVVVAAVFPAPEPLQLFCQLNRAPELEHRGAVEKREFLHAAQDDVRVEIQFLFEDLRIRLEAHFGTFFCQPRIFFARRHRLHRGASRETLRVLVLPSPHRDFRCFRKRVDHRNPHAVQPT
mmetsp:Transcript_1233/g.4075  ORF Transcript_1233/g.4075 Transcript_1233/m.4075 type:complete len:249 (+) Transcript_1233:1040-1786(+)